MSNTQNATPTVEELMAVINAKNAEIAALKSRPAGKVTCKVAEKSGALSVYGLGRFPVTLYASQWERLITEIPTIQKFIADNADELKRKEVA